MNLVLKTNYDAVEIAGKTVTLNENYNNHSMVNRLVETVSYTEDEAALNYIQDKDYAEVRSTLREAYRNLIALLNRKARIYNSFSIDSAVLHRNLGAGFCAVVKQKDYQDTVEIVERMLDLTGLADRYQLVSRFENNAVYAIIRK